MLPTPVPSAVPDPGRSLSVTAVPGERPGRVVVQVSGGVDAHTAPLLQLCLDSQASRRGLRELVVDLEQVTFLGAAGVTVLAQAHRRCRMRGARLAIRTGGRRTMLRPLQLDGLADVVALDPAEPEQPQTKGPGRRRGPPAGGGRRRDAPGGCAAERGQPLVAADAATSLAAVRRGSLTVVDHAAGPWSGTTGAVGQVRQTVPAERQQRREEGT